MSEINLDPHNRHVPMSIMRHAEVPFSRSDSSNSNVAVCPQTPDGNNDHPTSYVSEPIERYPRTTLLTTQSNNSKFTATLALTQSDRNIVDRGVYPSVQNHSNTSMAVYSLGPDDNNSQLAVCPSDP